MKIGDVRTFKGLDAADESVFSEPLKACAAVLVRWRDWRWQLRRSAAGYKARRELENAIAHAVQALANAADAIGTEDLGDALVRIRVSNSRRGKDYK